MKLLKVIEKAIFNLWVLLSQSCTLIMTKFDLWTNSIYGIIKKMEEYIHGLTKDKTIHFSKMRTKDKSNQALLSQLVVKENPIIILLENHMTNSLFLIFYKSYFPKYNYLLHMLTAIDKDSLYFQIMQAYIIATQLDKFLYSGICQLFSTLLKARFIIQLN